VSSQANGTPVLAPAPAPAPGEDEKGARALLRKVQDERVRACGAALQELLKQHRCTLAGIPQFVQQPNGGYITVVNIQLQPVIEPDPPA